MNVLIGGFLEDERLTFIFGGSLHDTIVPRSSQSGNAPADKVTIVSAVHSALTASELRRGETNSESVWAQILYELLGKNVAFPGLETTRAAMVTSQVTLPDLVLSGYTEVAASNVTLTPASGSRLTINNPVTIAATSSTKTVKQVVLFQAVTEPADEWMLFATQAPFGIPFTPARLGWVDFVVLAVFTDNTFAITSLSYPLQPKGVALKLELMNAPVAAMTTGESVVVRTAASFANGTVDVTGDAIYTARSKTSTVFSVGPRGAITATGPGEDWLEVAYGGIKTSTPVAVGNCQYLITPKNQVVPMSGGELVDDPTHLRPRLQLDCECCGSVGVSVRPYRQGKRGDHLHGCAKYVECNAHRHDHGQQSNRVPDAGW